MGTCQRHPHTAISDDQRADRDIGETAKGGRLAERVILDDDGMPLRREPVLSDEKWAEVARLIDASARPWNKRHDAAALLNVAFCGKCHKGLYGSHQTTKGRQYDYYDCSAHCGARRIPMVKLEAALDEYIIGQHGETERTVKHVKRGDDHSRKVAAVGKQIASLTTERFVRGVTRGDYDELMAQLQAEHARLSALPSEPDSVDVERTGVLIRDWWPALDSQEKRRFLLEHGFKVYATRQPDGDVGLGKRAANCLRRSHGSAVRTQSRRLTD